MRTLHSWDVTPREAREIQDRLRSRVVCAWSGGPIKVVAGTDVSFPSKDRALAAVVVLSYPGLEVLETAVSRAPCGFPYVPGLLSFREAPVLAQALSALKSDPDLILCDGQGTAHPRGMGLACHIGLMADRPTVGCAKSRLYGAYNEPARGKGSWSPLLGKESNTVGAVLRTRDNVSPVYVSAGHKVDLETAIEVILNCSPKYRIPEPLRMAHKLAAGDFAL